MPKVSAVIPIRYTDKYPRDMDRLDLCLKSLREQTVRSECIQIIVSDFGSEKKYVPALQEKCQKAKAKFVHIETQEVWSRAKALNIGIRASDPDSDYIISSDVDIIFKDTAIEEAFKNMDEKTYIIFEVRKLPPMKLPIDLNFTRLEAISMPEPPSIGICCFPRKWIFDVRGYDEEFKVWGWEDNDLVKRAHLSGLQIIRLPDLAFHLWHRVFYKVDLNDPQQKLNCERADSLNTIIRNTDRQWGEN